jgi:hypothetical protein
MNKLDKQGEAARKLQAEFAAEGKGYNERRKAQKLALRTVLTPVWTALKAGKTVNGQKGLERWAKWFNPVAKYPLRQLQRVMGEPSDKSEATSRRPKLVEGETYLMPDGTKGELLHLQMKGNGPKYPKSWIFQIVEEGPVVTPTPTVATKVQQGAITHQVEFVGQFQDDEEPAQEYTWCSRTVDGEYRGVPKTSIVSDNPTCKTCQIAIAAAAEREKRNQRYKQVCAAIHSEPDHDKKKCYVCRQIKPTAPTKYPSRAPEGKREGKLAGERFRDGHNNEIFRWTVRRFAGEWMIEEMGTSHPDMTHCGKSFKLKRDAWAYLNDTPATADAPTSEPKKPTPRCAYCGATDFISIVDFSRHKNHHIYTHDEHWKRHQQEQIEKYGDGSEETVTVVVKDGTVCEPSE